MMDDNDFLELLAMKRRDEPNEKIFKIFKVLRYTREEILDEIARAEAYLATEPTPKEEKEDKDIHIMHFQDFHSNAPILVLFICLFVICFSMLVWLDPLQRFESPSQEKWQVAVTPVSCIDGIAILKVQNLDRTEMPETEFFADGANCAPILSIPQGKYKHITCTGNIQQNITYALRSEITYPEVFRC